MPGAGTRTINALFFLNNPNSHLMRSALLLFPCSRRGNKSRTLKCWSEVPQLVRGGKSLILRTSCSLFWVRDLTGMCCAWGSLLPNQLTLSEVRWTQHALGSPFPWMAVQFSVSSLHQGLGDWWDATSPIYEPLLYLSAYSPIL